MDTYTKKFKYNFKISGYALTGVTTAINTGIGMGQNIQNGESAKEIWSDAAIDIGSGVWSIGASAAGAKLGSIIGTAICPGAGTALGVGIGIILGWGFNSLYSEVVDPYIDSKV